MFWDHYFKSILETTRLWTKFAPVQYSYDSSEPLGNFIDGVIPNYSNKVKFKPIITNVKPKMLTSCYKKYIWRKQYRYNDFKLTSPESQRKNIIQ